MPFYSEAQRSSVTTFLSQQEKLKTTLAQAIEANAAELDKARTLESTFSTKYSEYDRLIRSYDAERRALVGTGITGHVEDSELLSYAGSLSGDLAPTFPETKPKRIARFDGPTTDSGGEISYHAASAALEALLGTPLTSTAVTAGTIVSGFSATAGASITFIVTHTAALPGLVSGLKLRLGVTSGPGSLLVQTTSVTLTGTNRYTVVATALTSGDVATGASVSTLFSLSNTERSSGTSTANQQILDSLKAQLRSNRQSRLEQVFAQSTALAGNEDPALVRPDLTGILDHLKASLDVSNSGLAAMSQMRTDREAAASSRSSAIRLRLLELFNFRYQVAVLRVDRTTGSLIRVKSLEAAATQLQTQLARAIETADSLDKMFR